MNRASCSTCSQKPENMPVTVLKKEAIVQLAKQLNLFRAGEESSSCLSNPERSMWEISLTLGLHQPE